MLQDVTKRNILTKNLPLRDSLRCLSTALWVARRSVVLAFLLGFLLELAEGVERLA